MDKEGLKAAITMTVCLFIAQFFQLPYSDWILVTISIIYLAGSVTGLRMEKINKRILGSFVGLIIGILIMQCLGFYDYRILYFVPLTWFLMFYLYFLSNNYTYMAVFVSIMLLFSIAILAPKYNDWNIYNTAFARIICTVIGVLILIFTEYCLFYKESRSDRKIYPAFSRLIAILGTLSDEMIKLFQANNKNSLEFKKKYFELFDEVFKLHLLLRASNYEPTYDKNKIKFCEIMCDDLYTAMDYMREAMFITTHKGNNKTINESLLEEIRLYFIKEFNLKESVASLQDIIRNNKEAIYKAGRGSPEYYFLQALFRLNIQLKKLKETNKLLQINQDLSEKVISPERTIQVAQHASAGE